MGPIEMVSELSAALHDVITGTPDEALEKEPERVYMEMACRLVVRLAPKMALVPKEHVQPTPGVDPYLQMRLVSDDVVRVLAIYRSGGYDVDALLLALIDAYVRVARAETPGAKTSAILTRLSIEAREMAEHEAEQRAGVDARH